MESLFHPHLLGARLPAIVGNPVGFADPLGLPVGACDKPADGALEPPAADDPLGFAEGASLTEGALDTLGAPEGCMLTV